jgi:serine/threonine protein kinase
MMTLLTAKGLAPGTVIDGWKVLGPLGSGGFGAVQKAEKDGRLYAIKLALLPQGAHDERQTHERTLRELLCLLLLDHPYIIKVLAHGQWPQEGSGHLYLVLEYVEGWTLAEWVERMHPTAQEILRVFAKIAAALVHMHGRGVVHRDLKLTNVLIRKADGAPVLIDFGAADFAQAPELTDAGLPPGTERYRSPEANRFTYENRKNPRARYDFKVADELFAFGVMLHDALTDPRPTEERVRTDVNTVLVGLTPPEERNPRIPAALASLIRRLLSQKPDQRPENAEVVRRELEELVEHPGSEYRVPVHLPSSQVAEPPAPSEAPPQADGAPASKRRLRWTVALMGTLGLAALAALAVHSARRVEAPPPPAPMNLALPSPPVEPSTPSASPDSAGTLERLPDSASASIQRSPTVSVLPPHPEGPAMKTARSASSVCATPQQVPTFTSKARFRQWCQSAGVVGTALAFCAGCPGAQLRPEVGDCAPAVVAEMKKNGLTDGMGVYFNLDLPADSKGSAIIRSGKVTGVVSSRASSFAGDSRKWLPPGTLLFGQAWVTPGLPGPDPDGVMVRFERVRTPDDREFRVCIVGGNPDEGVNDPLDRPEPGAARMRYGQPATVVNRWPDKFKP